MTASSPDYAVGRGRPPLHTRFQKGQSGNPSGKPGPAKLARQRLQRAFLGALEGSPEDLARAKPGSVAAAIVRKMALDACDGRIAAVRQVLSMLEKESARPAEPDDDAADRLFTAAEVLSLLQGKKQGNEEQWLEELRTAASRENPARACDDDREVPASEPEVTIAPGRNEANPFSLQGKTQGNENIPTGQICPAAVADRPPPAAARVRLMTGTALRNKVDPNFVMARECGPPR